MRPSILVGITFAACLVGGAAWAATPVCSVRQEGDVVLHDAVVRLRTTRKVVVEQTQTVNVATQEQTFVSVLKRAQRPIFEFRSSLGPNGTVVIAQKFGRGFRGISEMTFRRTQGAVEFLVDGRRALVAGAGTSSPEVTFEDGQPPPKLRAKREAVRLLRKFVKNSPVRCPGPQPQALRPRDEVNDPFENECTECDFGCFLKGLACGAGQVAACAILPAGCVLQAIVAFFSDSLSCGDAMVACSDDCKAKGNECCRSFCGDQCCSGVHNIRTDWVCAGAGPENPGSCCPPESLCGPGCCVGEVCNDDEGCHQMRCADPGRGLCCRDDWTPCGERCCPAGWHCANPARSQCCIGDGCGGYCCPAGQRCRTPSEELDEIDCIACPADKTGPVCGDVCCAAGEVCGFGNKCCRPDQLCGGSCCAAENCLNGTTCCELPEGAPCGSVCCPALTTTCCNGQCCAGECIAGAVCCPKTSACGNFCCPTGSACTNPAAGTCEACALGQEPCPFAPGNPRCCPAGTSCCDNGQCCASPTGQCCYGDSGPVCAITCIN